MHDTFIPVMAGLDPAIQAHRSMKGGYVYIMSNERDGTLYVGATSNLSRRVWEHREGIIDGFTKHYGLIRLVYYEPYDAIRSALQREKNMKH